MGKRFTGVKIAINAEIDFVIRITIHTFAHSEKLVFLALRCQVSSDPEEVLKGKSI
jgi:hypothetical protein